MVYIYIYKISWQLYVALMSWGASTGKSLIVKKYLVIPSKSTNHTFSSDIEVVETLEQTVDSKHQNALQIHNGTAGTLLSYLEIYGMASVTGLMIVFA